MYEVIMCAIANALGIMWGGNTGARTFFSDHFKAYDNDLYELLKGLCMVHWHDNDDSGYYGIICKDEVGVPPEFLIRLYDDFDMVTTTHILTRTVVAYYEKLKKEKEKENEGM